MSNNNAPFPTTDQLDKFIYLQKLKYQNESRELFIREKDLDHQAKYANRLLEHQAEIEKQRPGENRKTLSRFAWIFVGITILFMLFAGFCIYLNKEDFLYSLLKGLGYVITTLTGYIFGKKAHHRDKKSLADDVQEF